MSAVLLVPVGPDARDLVRLADLIASVRRYEPELSTCVLIDDGPGDRPRAGAFDAMVRGGPQVITLRNPRRGLGNPGFGGLAVGVLHALGWIAEHLESAWVLKMDLDALAIGPFAAAIEAFLAMTPDAGLVGCVGETCNRHDPLFRQCLSRRSRLALAARMVPANAAIDDAMRSHLRREMPNLARFLTNDGLLAAFTQVRPHIELAMSNGLQAWEYCQGGAYAISHEMLRRLRTSGILEHTLAWQAFPFGEDEIVSMYAIAVGLRVCDLSDTGEPFGIQYRDLPWPPPELIGRQYGLTHSVKDGSRGSEDELRAWFAEYRTRH